MSETGAAPAAGYVTEILSPAILVSVLLLLQPVLAPGTTWAPGPGGLLLRDGTALWRAAGLKHRGRVTDHHVGDRRQRAPVLVMAGTSLLAGAFLLLALDAPAAWFGEMGTLFLGLLVRLPANLLWTLSVHSAVAAYVGVELLTPMGQVGPALAPALALAATVGWSRIELKDHIPTQVLAGLAVGCAVHAAGLAMS